MKILALFLALAVVLCVGTRAIAMETTTPDTIGVVSYEPLGLVPGNPLVQTLTIVAPSAELCGASKCKAGRISASASCDATTAEEPPAPPPAAGPAPTSPAVGSGPDARH